MDTQTVLITIAGSTVSIAGALWLLNRRWTAARREDRISEQDETILGREKLTLHQQSERMFVRMSQEIERLANTNQQQQQKITELYSIAIQAQNERVATNKRMNEMLHLLAEVKQAQQSMVKDGFLEQPLADIPTGIFKGDDDPLAKYR